MSTEAPQIGGSQPYPDMTLGEGSKKHYVGWELPWQMPQTTDVHFKGPAEKAHPDLSAQHSTTVSTTPETADRREQIRYIAFVNYGCICHLSGLSRASFWGVGRWVSLHGAALRRAAGLPQLVEVQNGPRLRGVPAHQAGGRGQHGMG